MRRTKAALAWRVMHCSVCMVGCLICAVVYPVALIVRGLAILEKWGERREALALRSPNNPECEG